MQLLALMTCPFPWLNLILPGSCQPLLQAGFKLEEWLLCSGSAGQGVLAGQGDEARGEIALLLHLGSGGASGRTPLSHGRGFIGTDRAEESRGFFPPLGY